MFGWYFEFPRTHMLAIDTHELDRVFHAWVSVIPFFGMRERVGVGVTGPLDH